MSERLTGEPAPLCSCPRPLVDEVRSCLRCGHELAGEAFALSPKAQRMARLIAEYVVELTAERQSRQKPGKHSLANNRAGEVSRRRESLGDQLPLEDGAA